MSIALKNPNLKRCTNESKLLALLQCCKLGLVPDDTLGLIYLIPFGKKCTVVPGYKGLITLARRSGFVRSINTAVVYANDEFDYVNGTDPGVTHRAWWMAGKDQPGEFVCAYCISWLTDDDRPQIDVMHKSEIIKIRDRKKLQSGSPWVTDFDEMAKKTTIRRASKRWTLSPEMARAMMLDDAADQEIDQEPIMREDMGTTVEQMPPLEAEPLTDDELRQMREQDQRDGFD